MARLEHNLSLKHQVVYTKKITLSRVASARPVWYWHMFRFLADTTFWVSSGLGNAGGSKCVY